MVLCVSEVCGPCLLGGSPGGAWLLTGPWCGQVWVSIGGAAVLWSDWGMMGRCRGRGCRDATHCDRAPQGRGCACGCVFLAAGAHHIDQLGLVQLCSSQGGPKDGWWVAPLWTLMGHVDVLTAHLVPVTLAR